MTEWQPIETAPKDGSLILGWCDHDADPYHVGNRQLTTYGAHAEGMGHASDGYQIVTWGGEYTETDDMGYEVFTIPSWWFVVDGEFETVANPTHWMPLPNPPGTHND